MVGIFVQKYEKIFFDFYCGKNFSWRRGDVETLTSFARGGGISYRLNECTKCMS